MNNSYKDEYQNFRETRRLSMKEFDYERYVKERSKYERRGKCKRCGRCCTAKGLIWSKIQSEEKGFTNEDELKAKIIEKWGEDGEEFYKAFLEMVCPHLKIIKRSAGKKRRCLCTVYDDRPTFCKDFPELPSEVVEGCGFYFKEKK